MELRGLINQREHGLHIERADEHHFDIQIDDRVYRVNCHEVMTNVYSLLLDRESVEVRVHQQEEKNIIETHFYEDSFEVEMSDPMRALLAESAGLAAKGEVVLAAAMPGKVQRIMVAEGEEVQVDQGLVVLVAMKMENELASPKSGRVTKILVKEGDSVEGGAPLVIVS